MATTNPNTYPEKMRGLREFVRLLTIQSVQLNSLPFFKITIRVSLLFTYSPVDVSASFRIVHVSLIGRPSWVGFKGNLLRECKARDELMNLKALSSVPGNLDESIYAGASLSRCSNSNYHLTRVQLKILTKPDFWPEFDTVFIPIKKAYQSNLIQYITR